MSKDSNSKKNSPDYNNSQYAVEKQEPPLLKKILNKILGPIRFF